MHVIKKVDTTTVNSTIRNKDISSVLLFSPEQEIGKPLLSILIPTFGRKEGLRRTVSSILSQTSPPFLYEIIIVSNDDINSIETISELKKIWHEFGYSNNLFIYCNEKNLGMVGNSIRCVELSKGDYFAFVHDDDYLLENYFSTVYKYFFCKEERADCLVIGRKNSYSSDNDPNKTRQVKKTRVSKFIAITRIFGDRLKEIHISDIMFSGRNCYLSPSCGTIISKKAYYDVGGFDSEIKYSWDFDFFLRLNQKHRIWLCPVRAAVYTIDVNASLKKEVKKEFFDYYVETLIPLYKKQKSCQWFINTFSPCILYDQYLHLCDFDNTKLPDISVQKPSRLLFSIYKIFTVFYYYSHNLDIQGLI